MPESPTPLTLSPRIRERQGRTRQRILDESARMFIRKGFENVSVEEIIESAGIARSSFYRFFANREQVLTNIVRPVFEAGVIELEGIDNSNPHAIMAGIFGTYLALWRSSPDALRVSSRMGGVHFYLFEDVHRVFREKVSAHLQSIEPSGIFLNGSADLTARILARTGIQILEIYGDDPDFERLFRLTMTGLLIKPEA
jgi:AcrR family transcriptional regulator